MDGLNYVVENLKGIRNSLKDTHVVEVSNKENSKSSVNLEITGNSVMEMKTDNIKTSSSPVHSLFMDGDICLFRKDSTLCVLDANYNSHILREGLTSGLPMSYKHVNNHIYYCDGATTGVIEKSEENKADGTYTLKGRSWGLEVPTSAELLPASGSLRPGRYKCTLTYLRSDDQESGSSLLSLVDLTESGFTIGVRHSTDPDVTAINIYVSTANEQGLYHLTTVNKDRETSNAKVSYYSFTSESQVDTDCPILTENLKAAPTGTAIEHYRGHMYVASGSTLWYSEPLSYELFDLSHNWIGFASPITMLGAVHDGMFVGTQKEVFFLKGTNTRDFERILVYSEGGVVPGSLVRGKGTGITDNTSLEGDSYGGDRGDVLFWMTNRGIYAGSSGGKVEGLTSGQYDFSSLVAKSCAASVVDDGNEYDRHTKSVTK